MSSAFLYFFKKTFLKRLTSKNKYGIIYDVTHKCDVLCIVRENLIVGKMIYCTAGLSLSRIPSLVAYKRAWRIFVGYAKRIRETSFTSHFEIGLHIYGVVNHTIYMQEYRSGHNEAVLKICRSSGRQKAETPWKHWLFRHCKNRKTTHI